MTSARLARHQNSPVHQAHVIDRHGHVGGRGQWLARVQIEGGPVARAQDAARFEQAVFQVRDLVGADAADRAQLAFDLRHQDPLAGDVEALHGPLAHFLRGGDVDESGLFWFGRTQCGISSGGVG
jgi:hypothetical protein